MNCICCFYCKPNSFQNDKEVLNLYLRHCQPYKVGILCLNVTTARTFFLVLFLIDGLGSLACPFSELILKFESYRQLAGPLGRMISPVARPLPTQDNTNTEETQISMQVGFEPRIPVFETTMTFRALDRVASVFCPIF
jgi:hypothetical protein